MSNARCRVNDFVDVDYADKNTLRAYATYFAINVLENISLYHNKKLATGKRMKMAHKDFERRAKRTVFRIRLQSYT